MQRVLWIGATLSCMLATTSYARFMFEDSQEIDPDFSLNTKTWNDKNSYRLPLSWRRHWQQAHSGVRISAGSLNASRFNYDEELRFDPIPLEPVSLAFERSRTEDYAEQQVSQWVQLGIKVIPQLRLLVLGDVASAKEYGDLGFGVRLFESNRHTTDLYFWSVDHYYNEKNHLDGATRSDLARTWGIRSRYAAEPGGLGWSIVAESDQPFELDQPGLSVYTYERMQTTYRLDWRQDTEHTWYLSGSIDKKSEGHRSPGFPTSGASLAMHRDATVIELGWELLQGEQSWTMGLQTIQRRTVWTATGDTKTQQIWSPTLPPQGSIREEYAGFVTREHPVQPKLSFIQGLYINDARIAEDQTRWHVMEWKYQTAFSLQLGEKSFFGLNATWDLDQLARDYPYRNAAFRPWGGGDIQVQILL